MSRTHWVIYVKSFSCHEASECRQLYQSSKCQELSKSSEPNESSVWPAIQLDPTHYIEFVKVTNSMSHQDDTNSISHLNSTSHLCDQSFNSIRLKSSTMSRTQWVIELSRTHWVIYVQSFYMSRGIWMSRTHWVITMSLAHWAIKMSRTQWVIYFTMMIIRDTFTYYIESSLSLMARTQWVCSIHTTNSKNVPNSMSHLLDDDHRSWHFYVLHRRLIGFNGTNSVSLLNQYIPPMYKMSRTHWVTTMSRT